MRAIMWSAALATLGLTGCYHYALVNVRAVWSETGKPAAGVAIRPFYKTFMEPFPPRNDAVATDADGRATIPVAIDPRTRYAGLFVEGYMLDGPEGSYDGGLNLDELRHWYEVGKVGDPAGNRPAEVTLKIMSKEAWHARSRSR